MQTASFVLAMKSKQRGGFFVFIPTLFRRVLTLRKGAGIFSNDRRSNFFIQMNRFVKGYSNVVSLSKLFLLHFYVCFAKLTYYGSTNATH